MPAVQIVVTCSERKTSQVPHRLRLGSLPQGSDRTTLWIDRLRKEVNTSIPAIDLYAGEHWSAVKDLMAVAARSGFTPDLWICSAGYGLVPGAACLKPYAATFARGHSDSIDRAGDPASVAKRWWSELASWKGPAVGHHRSIRGLAMSRPRTPLLIVASPSYLRVFEADAAEAGQILQDRLFVVSTGAKRVRQLRDFLVPVDARFQHRVGGSRVSLNVRIAAFLLEQSQSGLDRERIFSKLDRVSKDLPAIPVYEGVPLKDEQVIGLIRRSIRGDRSISATSALQNLRREGWACEQKRFGHLFRAVKEGPLGG